MAEYWQLNPLNWGQGDIFRKGGTKIKKSKNIFSQQNVSSEYFSERKNWEEYDKNTFRSIWANEKKLLRKCAKKKVIF
jgi:hypothetical protein